MNKCLFFQGKYYLWEEHLNENEPCALFCQAVTDPDIVVRMDDTVIDGTRCKEDSLDMCIDGICKVRTYFIT